MITLRKSDDRGHADHGWLQSHHSFSFADYRDARHMGFANLRVINEDRIAPGTGFGAHGHRDMEIVTYVLEGELAHQDDMGNGTAILPGDVQRMSAGRGVVHSERNSAAGAWTHLLQIWIEPNRRGIAPEYEQHHVPAAVKRGRLALVAARDGREGALTMHADADLYAGLFTGDEAAELPLAFGHQSYVHVVRGTIDVNGTPLATGDAAKLVGEPSVRLSRASDAEVLVFDLGA